MAAHDAADGVLGSKPFLDDQCLDFTRQGRVFNEMGVGGKNRTVLGAYLFRDRLLIATGVPGGGSKGLVQAAPLLLQMFACSCTR